MIFKELIEDLRHSVAAAVNELFGAAEANQTHPQDLLLVDQHGFHSQQHTPANAAGGARPSPPMLGPDLIGFAESTFYKFMDRYRRSHVILDRAEFAEHVAEDPEALTDEELFLQIEQGIYLRFWESDLILKRLHQLASLCIGESYDWFLEIPGHPRGRVIRDGIRDRVKDVCPTFYALVKGNYKSQVRNAIAHSRYCTVGRNIVFLNYSDDPRDYAPLQKMCFDDWYAIFHTMLLLHNELIGAFSLCRETFKRRTLDNENRIEVRVTSRDGLEEFCDLAMRPGRDEWVWRENLPRHAVS